MEQRCAEGGVLFRYNRLYGGIYMEVEESFGRRGLTIDPVALDDLKREARGAIAHQHIVKIHDFVADGKNAAI